MSKIGLTKMNFAMAVWFAAIAPLLAAGSFTNEIQVLDGERWWGGGGGDGQSQPYGAGDSRRIDLRTHGNTSSPLLVSSFGRYVWSEKPFGYEFKDGKLVIDSDAEKVECVQAGSTLKDAYLAAAKAHMRFEGKTPPDIFFTLPQWNNWIEIFLNGMDQKAADDYAGELAKSGFPCGVYMMDGGWLSHQGSYEFYERDFPDPKGMFDRINAQGWIPLIWTAHFVSPDSREYKKLRHHLKLNGLDYLAYRKKPNSHEAAVVRWWSGISAIYDLTKPEANAYYAKTLHDFADKYGIKGYKFDAGDPRFFVEDCRFHDESAEPVDYTRLYAELAAREFPYHEIRVSWKCGGLPLVTRLNDRAHAWTGREGQDTVVPQVIAAGLLGCPYLVADMVGGGLEVSFVGGKMDEKLFVRSAALQSLMPMMQFSPAPWRHLSPEGVRLCRKFADLHVSFAPYILETARHAAMTGEPIVRAMEYEFPHQGFNRPMQQFMLGSRWLVAPVVTPDDAKTVELPAGTWRDDLGETHVGPKTLRLANVPLDRLPRYERVICKDDGVPCDFGLSRWDSPKGLSNIWTLMFCPTNDFMKNVWARPKDATNFRREKLEDGDRFVWSGFRGGGLEDILDEAAMTVRRDPSKPGRLRWRLSATPKPGWAIACATCPRLDLVKDAGGDGDRIVNGAGGSGIFRNPSDTVRNPSRYGRVLFDARQPSELAAQFLCRYTDDALFYTAAEDGEGWEKAIVCSREEESLNVRWTQWCWYEGRYEQPYDVVTDILERRDGEPCAWQDAADEYRKWAERQRWCRRTLLERDDLAPLYRDAPVYFLFRRNDGCFENIEKVKRIVTRNLNELHSGAPAFATIHGWEKWYEWIGPDYFPMYPDEKTTRGLLSFLRGAGVRPFLWPSTCNYTLKFRYPDYFTGRKAKATEPFDLDLTEQFLAEGLDKWAAVDKNGNWQDSHYWLGAGGKLATLCMDTPVVDDWFARTTVRPLMERGATLFQLDQFNICCTRQCWSRDHGHTPHSGRWHTDAGRRFMAKASSLMRSYDPEASIAYEGPNEQFLDLIAVQGVRDCGFTAGEWANVYTYLYHDYVIPFQSTWWNMDRVWLAKSAAEGQMPRFPNDLGAYGDDGEIKNESDRRFFHNWVDLYRGEGRKFLAHGRQVRPPRLECARMRYVAKVPRAYDIDLPTVFHASYEAADGTCATVLANATEEQQTLTLSRGNRRSTVVLAPREIRLVNEDAK